MAKRITKAALRRRRQRKKRALVIAAITTLSVLAFVLIGGGTYVLFLLGRVNFVKPGNESYTDSFNAEPADPGISGVVVNDPVDINDMAASVSDIKVQGNTKVITNILLLGIETENKNNYTGRSDTMMILSINKYTKTIKMISLMRDTYVTLPERGLGKLNSAYERHGFELLQSTIETNFRLKIDKFVAVNFSAFSKLVDAMKGVDIQLTGAEAKIVGVGYADGRYHLDGAKALTYSRIRKIGNDFGRNSRQRTVIKALMETAKSMDKATMLGVLDKALGMISTNMGKSEFLGYILSASSYLKYETSEYYVPQQSDYNDIYVPIPGTSLHMQVLELKDPKASVLNLHHQIYG